MAAMVGAPSLCAVATVGSTASSITGDRVRVQVRAVCACAGKGLQVVMSNAQPWDTQRAGLFSVSGSATETSTVATDFVVAQKGRTSSGSFGYSRGTDSEEDEDESDVDDEEEVIRVDNESIDDADQLAIDRLGIPDAVVEALAKRGITQLFPIQRAVLDPAMEGRDLIARAKTGTGKTLAFGIPIINNILRENEGNRTARCGLPGVIDVEAFVHDEEWQKARREETRQLEKARQVEREVEAGKEAEYRKIGSQLKDYPEEDVIAARKFVASLIKAGEEVEEMIENAGESGELTPLLLLVIRNRLELARQDDERNAIQALDLLYRRVEMEMLQSEASAAMLLLNQLLNLHDGFSHEEWLRRARNTMLQIFPPEDAFTTMIDLENQMGPIEIPEEDDALLRIDFIREVDDLLVELEAAAAAIKPVSGLDAESVAVRLRQQDKLRAIEQVKDLRHLAATLTI